MDDSPRDAMPLSRDRDMQTEEKGRRDRDVKNGGVLRAERPQHDRGPAEAKEDPKQKGSAVRRTLSEHPYLVAASVILVILVIIAAFLWWLNARHFEDTDDAFIDTRIVAISAQVAGAITDVPVTDNQL